MEKFGNMAKHTVKRMDKQPTSSKKYGQVWGKAWTSMDTQQTRSKNIGNTEESMDTYGNVAKTT